MQSIDSKLSNRDSDHAFIATWLNHFSVQKCMQMGIDLSRFDSVGLDGIFLLKILGLTMDKRSSADLYLPRLLAQKRLTIGLIGGTDSTKIKHKQDIELKFPKTHVLWSLNGFEEALTFVESDLSLIKPEMIIVGAGPGVQEQIALALQSKYEAFTEKPYIFTCGGWMDQISIKNYYPPWAYPLKLNWFVRLAREPKRLLPRYTYWAIQAQINRKSIRQTVLSGGNLSL